MLNRGAVALSRLDKTQAEIAAELGTQQSVVCRWLSGERKPLATFRVRLRELYQIDFESWDVAVRRRAA